jgi:hypothetical protein
MLQRFSPRAVGSEGNCFYQAVSLGLFGTQSEYAYLRLITAMQITENRSLYEKETDSGTNGIYKPKRRKN